MIYRSRIVSLFSLICLSFFPGLLRCAVVTLDSIEIYKTHEWLTTKPTVYFKCNGENMTVLPDVEKAHVLYTFKGQESWQPLTEFLSEKCKRCGFFEKDTIKSDDKFDEWEFCPSDFTASDGKYRRIKDKEFNATFLCPECLPLAAVVDPPSASGSHKEGKGMHVAVIIMISAAVSAVLVVGLIAGYKYWLKKKREQEQARFLKLFEDGDEIEDELGLDV